MLRIHGPNTGKCCEVATLYPWIQYLRLRDLRTAIMGVLFLTKRGFMDTLVLLSYNGCEPLNVAHYRSLATSHCFLDPNC